jgi:hypothetical protein
VRTLSSALVTAQQNTLAKPYIKCSINSVNYWSKLLYMEHTEQPYLEYANIILENHDRVMDSTDLTGYEVIMANGHNTGLAVAEPNGDGTVYEYSHVPNLWVKEQSISSVECESFCELYCEGMWAKLRETKVVAFGSTMSNIKDIGDTMVPYYKYQFTNLTIWELMYMILYDVMGWTLNTLAVTGTTSDGIIDVTKPVFTVNNTQPETAASMLYRLIGITKSYLRPRYDKTWDIIYPQIADVANRTFYSYQVPYFNEYREKVKVLIPNSIAVFCNNPDELEPWPTPVIVGLKSEIHSVYGEVLDIDFAPGVTNQADATNVAAAILTKILAEKDAGRLLITHDAGVELYDKLAVKDSRGL